jgi:hypothetical protein
MSQFNYTLPSGATFTMEAPKGTTQAQADYTFYSQVAAGALVGFAPGQSISGTMGNLAKFNLTRLNRGIAGVDETVILAIVNGLPTTASIPNLINVPLENPVTQANIAAVAGTGFTAPAIGSLTSSQTQALMAQVINTVGQLSVEITNNRGVGQYGFSCQQLEMAGYVKPGTWQQFVQNRSSTLIQVLNVPGIWTGLSGIYSLQDFLNSTAAQNDAQATLMQNGYNSLQAAGVITTPAAQSVSAVVGTVYTGTNEALTTATTTLTNTVNSQVAALVTNSSQYGTQLTAQWAAGLPEVTNVTSNLTGITGAIGAVPGLPSVGTLTSGVTPDLASVQTAMNTLGKASQFAATAAATLAGGIGKLSTLSLSDLPSASDLLAKAQGQIVGQASALVGQLKGQATAFANQIQSQASALIAQAEAQASALFTQADSLVADVQKAAAFANTVDRATVDVAFKKILGSAKISTPNFGGVDSASVGAALDISKAQAVLADLQQQGGALLSQAQGAADDVLASAKAAVNQIV